MWKGKYYLFVVRALLYLCLDFVTQLTSVTVEKLLGFVQYVSWQC